MKDKAYIFDLDGVIVDTAKFHFLAWRKLANSIDIDFSEEQNEQLKGVSRIRSLEKILKWGNKSLPEDEFMELMSRKNEDYLSHVAQMTDEDILPDVNKVLDFLISKDCKIALGSASKNARMILRKVGLINKFDVIVDGTNVTKAKPDPEVFLKAAEALNVAPKDCVVFEDSVSGVQAANFGKMTSIGIGDKEFLHEADHVFKDFTEISVDFLKGI